MRLFASSTTFAVSAGALRISGRSRSSISAGHEAVSAGRTTAFAIRFENPQHTGMETLPPFQTVYFVILKGYVVGEVTGLHFDRDFGVLHDDFDGRVVVRSSVVIEPNNEGRILLFCIIAQREFRQTIVFIMATMAAMILLMLSINGFY